MNRSHSSAVEPVPRQPRRLGPLLGAVGLGVPAAVGFLALVFLGLLGHPTILRYFQHPVECVEVVMFGAALGAFLAKLIGNLIERAAFQREIIEAWDGQTISASRAGTLLHDLQQLPRQVRGSLLVRRVRAVLDFLHRRRSAAELDDQLRALSDSDSMALEASYSLTRFITWAIPILGFLGTVLGITEAITGVTPEKLEKDLSSVTDGLALAFDSTALALGLTMITMFLSSLLERAEQAVLEAVDGYVDRELAHRFERTGAEGNEAAEVIRQHGQAVLGVVEQLVQRQAAIWSQALTHERRQSQEAEEQLQGRLASALETALDRTLAAHQRRLAALEQQTLERETVVVEKLEALAQAIHQAGLEHQAALAHVTERITAQTQALASLQEGEQQLLQLQDVLHRNLAALAGAGAFEEAVQSLTGAVHLLTGKLSSASPALRIARPGNAA